MAYRNVRVSAPGPFPHSPPFGLGALPSPPPGSLGWVPGPVQIDGIPRSVSAPMPNPATFRRIAVPSGTMGTLATLQIIADLAREAASDPFFIQEARGIVRGNGSKNYERDAQSIMNYGKQNVDYRPDPIGDMLDYICSPGWVLFVDGQEDCDSLAGTIAGLDLAAGLGAAVKAVRLDPANPDQFSHVYALAGVKDDRGNVRWLAQDTVPRVARLGWEPSPQEQVGPANMLVIAYP